MDAEPGSEPRRFREIGRALTRLEACWLVAWMLLFPVGLLWYVRQLGSSLSGVILWWAAWGAVLIAGCAVPRVLLGRRYIELGPDGIRDVSRLGRCRIVPYESMRTVSGREERNGAPRFEIRGDGRVVRLDCWLSGWPELLAELWRRQQSLQVALPGRLPNRIRAIRDGISLTPRVDVGDPGPFRYSFGLWRVACLFLWGASAGLSVAASLLDPAGPSPKGVAWLGLAVAMAVLLVWDWRAHWARVCVEIRPDRLLLTDFWSGRLHDIPWGDLVEYSVIRLPGGMGPVYLVHARGQTLPRPGLLPGVGPFEDALIDALWKMDTELAARQW